MSDPTSANAATSAEPTLEQLVEAGEVEAALLLKGVFTRHEMELVRDAWKAGIEMGKRIERSRRAHGTA